MINDFIETKYCNVFEQSLDIIEIPRDKKKLHNIIGHTSILHKF